MNDPDWINGDDPEDEIDEEYLDYEDVSWDPADPPYDEDEDITQALNAWEAEKESDPWYA